MTGTLTYEETSRQVAIPTGKLHYHDAGEGPLLLMLHGSGPGVSGWSNFGGNLETFARHFRTLVLDLPGFGASDTPAGHPLEDAPAAVLAFLDELGIERVKLLGNSMGGNIGARIAAHHPARVERLAAMGGVGEALMTAAPAEGIRLLIEFTEDPSRERFVRWAQSMVYDPAILTDELIDTRYEKAIEPVALAWARKIFSRPAVLNAGSPRPAPNWAHLTRIEAPVLLLWGRDDRVSPLDRALLPMRLIPKCELHTFYDCGHWAQIERRSEFESVVRSFFLRDAPE